MVVKFTTYESLTSLISEHHYYQMVFTTYESPTSLISEHHYYLLVSGTTPVGEHHYSNTTLIGEHQFPYIGCAMHCGL